MQRSEITTTPQVSKPCYQVLKSLGNSSSSMVMLDCCFFASPETENTIAGLGCIHQHQGQVPPLWLWRSPGNREHSRSETLLPYLTSCFLLLLPWPPSLSAGPPYSNLLLSWGPASSSTGLNRNPWCWSILRFFYLRGLGKKTHTLLMFPSNLFFIILLYPSFYILISIQK